MAKNAKIENSNATFWVLKSWWKMPKMVNLTSFWKPEGCGQKVLPDKSVLIWRKLVENAEIENLKWDILADFQTPKKKAFSVFFL